MAFTHTPYAGSKRPFTIAAERLAISDWIEPDEHLARDLCLKQGLLRERFDAVARFLQGTQAAQSEVLDLLVAHLVARFPKLYRLEEMAVHVVPCGRSTSLDPSGEPPLVAAARLVQEDLCLLRRDAQTWRLVAAVLCFPSGWSLAEKIGCDLAAVHAPVPGFAGRMAQTVARMFDRLDCERPLVRWNWSIYGDGAMRQEPAEGEAWARFPAQSRLQQAHLRIERQTLRKLPGSGDILFTIRIHSDPLTALAKHPHHVRLAEGLRSQLLALNEAELAHKGLTAVRDDVAALLARIVAG